MYYDCHVIVQDWYKKFMYWYKTVMYWYKKVMYCTRQSCTGTRYLVQVQNSLVPEQECYVLVQDILYWYKVVIYGTRKIHDKNMTCTSTVQAST